MVFCIQKIYPKHPMHTIERPFCFSACWTCFRDLVTRSFLPSSEGCRGNRGRTPSVLNSLLYAAKQPITGSMIFGLALAMSLCVQTYPTRAQTEFEPVDVAFLTLRNRTTADLPADSFGDQRGTLSAGICRVRSLDFGALVPLAQTAPAYVQEEFLRIDAIQEMPPAEILAGGPSDTDDGSRVVYVHGYNIGFAKGCRRAALLQRNARLEDRMLWFSWPSDGAVTNYLRDESDLYWSVPDLADTLLYLVDQNANPVDVVGHSLGARGVVLALSEVANRRPGARLGDIVLLAPDMDFEIFGQFLPRILSIATSLTVYVTDGDRPLALSAQLHGYPRLGQAANDVSGLAGVEVVDLSALDVEDLTGHLYHIFSPEVGADLDLLLNEGVQASDRPGLRQIGPNRWQMDLGPDAQAK